MSDSLWPHGPQHVGLPCPSPSPGACSYSSTESMMPSNHLILCHPLLLLPSIFPSIRVFSNESFDSLQIVIRSFPCSSVGKESTCNAGDTGVIPGLGRTLEEVTAVHSSILAWRIPWTEVPARLQSMGLHRVRYNWSNFAHIHICPFPGQLVNLSLPYYPEKSSSINHS